MKDDDSGFMRPTCDQSPKVVENTCVACSKPTEGEICAGCRAEGLAFAAALEAFYDERRDDDAVH